MVPERLVPAAVVARELLLAMAVRMTQQRWLVSPGTGLARRPVKKPSFLAVLAVLWVAERFRSFWRRPPPSPESFC